VTVPTSSTRPGASRFTGSPRLSVLPCTSARQAEHVSHASRRGDVLLLRDFVPLAARKTGRRSYGMSAHERKADIGCAGKIDVWRRSQRTCWDSARCGSPPGHLGGPPNGTGPRKRCGGRGASTFTFTSTPLTPYEPEVSEKLIARPCNPVSRESGHRDQVA